MKNREKFEATIRTRAVELQEQVDRMHELIEATSSDKGSLNESSLSRVWAQSEANDIAIISANRTENVNCVKIRAGETEGQRFTKEQNFERSKDLQALLLNKGYGITKVKGAYIENFKTPQAVTVSEDSFFVVNFNDEPDFFDNIIKYGKHFCQDSVCIKRKGQDAELYGTNHSSFPGLDNTVPLGKFKGGEEAEFMTKVNKRPFQFAESHNVSGRYLISKRAKAIEKEME